VAVRAYPPALKNTLRLLSSVAAQIRRTLNSADVDAVHDLRVATRRFLAALEVFAPLLPGDSGRVAKKVKKVLDPAGAVRDLDVAAKLIAKFGAPQEITAELATRRGAAAVALKEYLGVKMERDSIAKWRVRLRGAAPEGDVVESTRPILNAMGMEFMRRGKIAADPNATDLQLHHFRIAAKTLRYSVELPVDPPISWREDAKAVQRLVGEIHDCEAVRLMIQDLPQSADLIAALGARRNEKLGEFHKLWQEHFANRDSLT
jgi:CHAD domain-containing protein